MNSREGLRWGVVGLGNVVTTRFVPAVAATADASIVACAARDPAKARAFAEKLGGICVHPTYDALLADDDVDAVYIATPNSLHAGQAIAGLAAGKHVLCEKPLALGIDDGRRIVAAASRAGRTLGIAFQFRFEPVFERARALIGTGRIGELRTITLLGCSPAGAPGMWRRAPGEGGILSDLGVHLYDLLPWMTGLPYARVSAAASPPDLERIPVETVSVMATLGDRCHAFIQASREIPGGQQSLLVEGTAGTLWCPAWRGASQVVLSIRDAAGTTEETIVGAPAFNGLVAAFVATTRGEQTALAEGEDGLRNIAFSAAVRRAAGERIGVELA